MNRKVHILIVIAGIFLCSGKVYSQTHDSSSVERSVHKYDLLASPNPFEDKVTLTINTGNKPLVAIRIFDLIGKEVAYIDLRNKSGIFTYEVNFSELKPSVYFCNVYGQNGIIESKKLFRTK